MTMAELIVVTPYWYIDYFVMISGLGHRVIVHDTLYALHCSYDATLSLYKQWQSPEGGNKYVLCVVMDRYYIMIISRLMENKSEMMVLD